MQYVTRSEVATFDEVAEQYDLTLPQLTKARDMWEKQASSGGRFMAYNWAHTFLSAVKS